MTIALYRNYSPSNYLDKVITVVHGGISIVSYSAVNINHPTFIIDYVPNYIRVNYARVIYDNGDEKYYYCTVSLNNGGQLILTCDIDPLMTNLADILDCSATILRYSHKGTRTGATMFPDDKYPIIPNKKEIKSTILNSTFFNRNASNCYLLSVIGE